MFNRSSNPTLGANTFTRYNSVAGEETMTLNGTINKVGILTLLVLLGASFTWRLYFSQMDAETGKAAVLGWMIFGAIGGLIMALVTAFKREWSPYTAPIYAVLQGLFLGAISAFFNHLYGEGIVIKAVALTMGTLIMLLFAYKTKIIRATENFKLGVFAATGGIALVYFITFILSMFGVRVNFMYDSSPISIIISLVVIVVAALNLILDFDFIEQGTQANAPKYMEWYGAFGLMVTLIWLYIEFLKLLGKLSNRN